MKKLFILFIVFLLCLSFCACNDNEIDGGFTVTYYNEQNLIYKQFVVEPGSDLQLIPVPEKAGYVGSWQGQIFDSMPNKNISFKLKYTPKSFTVYLDKVYNYAECVSSISVTYGTRFTLPTPSCSGASFKSWVKSGTKEVVSSGIYMVDGDLYLTAVWLDDWTINF